MTSRVSIFSPSVAHYCYGPTWFPLWVLLPLLELQNPDLLRKAVCSGGNLLHYRATSGNTPKTGEGKPDGKDASGGAAVRCIRWFATFLLLYPLSSLCGDFFEGLDQPQDGADETNDPADRVGQKDE
jgi:hypothetical protein